MGLKSKRKGQACEREAANYQDGEWKAIPCTSGVYLASSMGEIRRAKKLSVGRPVRAASVQIGKSGGYALVNIQFGDKWRVVTVHSLVAEAFIGVRPHGLHINHKDGNKLNNAASNLEYVTRSENMKHAMAFGLWSPPRATGERNAKATLVADDVRKMVLLEHDHTKAELAEMFSVSRGCVRDILSGHTWSHVTGRGNRNG